MAFGVGLRVGSAVSTAVVASNDPGSPDPVVRARDSVLHIDRFGTTSIGGPPDRDDDIRTVSGFLTRLPEDIDVVGSDGRAFRPADTWATALACLLHECDPLPTSPDNAHEPDVDGIVATYPSWWDGTTVARARAALARADLGEVTLVSDAEASAAWYASEVSETPGQLVGVFHLDDSGTTVALVRAGVPAGKALRNTGARGGGAPSPAAQLATILGAFGWLPANLDAVVVVGDGLIARDRSHVQDVALGIAEKLHVRAVVGPGPEQTAALGAAILAAGFVPARRTDSRFGLPPSYDVTDVLTGGFAQLRLPDGTTIADAAGEPDRTGDDAAGLPDDPEAGSDAPWRPLRSPRPVVAAAVVFLVLAALVTWFAVGV